MSISALGFGKGEVVRAEADAGVFAVQAFGENFERAFEVAHRDALVDDQAFDLVEDRRVVGVDGV